MNKQQATINTLHCSCHHHSTPKESNKSQPFLRPWEATCRSPFTTKNRSQRYCPQKNGMVLPLRHDFSFRKFHWQLVRPKPPFFIFVRVKLKRHTYFNWEIPPGSFVLNQPILGSLFLASLQLLLSLYILCSQSGQSKTKDNQGQCGSLWVFAFFYHAWCVWSFKITCHLNRDFNTSKPHQVISFINHGRT